MRLRGVWIRHIGERARRRYLRTFSLKFMTDNLCESSTRCAANFAEDDTSSSGNRRCRQHSRVADQMHRDSFFLLPGCPHPAEGKRKSNSSEMRVQSCLSTILCLDSLLPNDPSSGPKVWSGFLLSDMWPLAGEMARPRSRGLSTSTTRSRRFCRDDVATEKGALWPIGGSRLRQTQISSPKSGTPPEIPPPDPDRPRRVADQPIATSAFPDPVKVHPVKTRSNVEFRVSSRVTVGGS